MRAHPDHIRDELIRRVRAGEKRCEVATELGVSYPYASRVCKAAGIPNAHSRKGWTHKEVVTLLRMYDAGRQHVAIAGKLGRSMGSIGNALTYYKRRRAEYLDD